MSPAVASGSIRIVGELADLDHLLVDTRVDSMEMRLFDYALRNEAPIHLALDRRQLIVDDLRVVGEGTKLRISGNVGLRQNRIALEAAGDANLGILQGFFRNVRGSGHAELTAAINGPFDRPIFSGRATIAKGRIRHLSLPNSFDSMVMSELKPSMFWLPLTPTTVTGALKVLMSSRARAGTWMSKSVSTTLSLRRSTTR